MGVILGYMVTSLMTEIDIDEIEVKVIAHNLNHYIPSKESATRLNVSQLDFFTSEVIGED